jgi:DNA repair exonuclease SbcCD ATPase subunit
MKLAYVELAGFRGFRSKTRFEFPRGFAVITGRNGVGKSTAFDAIDFALTGSINKYDVRAAKGGGLEDHVWWVGDGRAEEQFVSVGFVDDFGTTATITRHRDGVVATEQLEVLAKHLCVDLSDASSWPEILMGTSLIRDERISALSLDLTEQARFTAVRAALGANDAPQYEERAKEITKWAKIARDEQQIKHSKVHEDLGRALSSLTEARSSASQQMDTESACQLLREIIVISDSDPVALANASRTFIATERQTLVSMRVLLADADRLVREREGSGGVSEQSLLSQQRERENQLRTQLSEAQEQLNRASAAFEQARLADEHAARHLALLEQGEQMGLQNGQCPLCASSQSDVEFESAIATTRSGLVARIPTANLALQSLTAERQRASQLETALSEIAGQSRTIEAQLQRREEDFRRLNQEFAKLELGTTEDIAAATEKFIKRQDQITRVEEAVFALDASRAFDRVATFEVRAEQLRELVESEALKLSQTERAVELAQQAEKAVRQVANELLSEQFDTVLPLLKELYRRLRPHADWREIEIDIAGQVRASLNFTVGDGYNPQFLFSSGQRRAAGLAFLLAIHLSRPWCSLNTLMLDDPIQHIDDYRSLNLVEVLSSIRRNGRQVIIAVEDSALADVLCRRLRCSMVEGGRRFELGTDVDGSSMIRNVIDVAPLSGMILDIRQAS